MKRKAQALSDHLPKVLAIGIQSPYNKTKNIESYFQEFRSLLATNGVPCAEELYLKLREINSAYFFTKGKLTELSEFCEKHEIDHVILSEALTPMQERNLEDALHCKVFDRTRLILDIFEKSAHTAEGKIQVAIAILSHKKTRLSGKGTGMAQQKGTIGVRGGFGETAKEKEVRGIKEGILKLKRQLADMKKSHDTKRKRRLDNRIPHACLIGYTNAGKSTILNALTKSDTLAEDKLFATLDTTTRELYVNGHKKGLLSDTVGFIQQLPHHLIEAFKSTLSELQYADLLIQVVDISDAAWENHIKVVHEILKELHVDKPMLYVFNKADRIKTTDTPEHLQKLAALEQYQPHVMTSALTKDGLQQLTDYMDAWQPASLPAPE